MDWLLTPVGAASAAALRAELTAFLRRHAEDPADVDDARLVVSEPLGELQGAWREVPESTCVVVRHGSEELRPFVPTVLEAAG